MISVDLIGIQLDPVSGAAALVLREHDAPNRLLPIVVGHADASSIAIAATGATPPRPLTHDLMASVVDALDGHLDAVEVTELHDEEALASLSMSLKAAGHTLASAEIELTATCHKCDGKSC